MKLLMRYCSAYCAILAAVLIHGASIAVGADVPHVNVVESTKPDKVVDTIKPTGYQPNEVVEKTKPVEGTAGAVEEKKKSEENIIKEDSEKTGTEGSKPDAEVEKRRTGESESAEVMEERKTEEDKPNTAACEKAPKKKSPDPIEPLYVHVLTQIGPGHNDSNPVWSPSGQLIAFERSIRDKKEVIIARLDGSIVQKIYFRLSEDDNEMSFFFPGIFEEISYNAGITWASSEDRFVFMSNGGGGNYDLYLRELGSKTTRRLTEHQGKDGHAQWSPVADQLVFVSGRKGKADIYLMDLANESTTRLTHGEKAYLYPQWSPDGTKLLVIYGSNENHDVYLIGDVTKPGKTMKALTTWKYDDLRPKWSPDGKKIAFYSNYNPENDPTAWTIIVIAADGSDPTEGKGLAAKIVASNVIPDIERGPAWMPDSAGIVYVKDDKQAYNPIYVVDIEKKIDLPLKTETKMNHDVACSAHGTIAFRTQVEQWDHIHIVKLKE